ncbi:MAG TPA: cation transporter [Pirellulaceae bacterium]|jgi:Co/Zn/Cd efflux system component|nr:cation transporter [Pirellulaceae bacterium]
MERLKFDVPKMDCGAEEQLIRMQLGDRSDVLRIACDLSSRTVDVVHNGAADEIERAFASLNLGASLVDREPVETLEPSDDDRRQRQTLISVLAINASLFVVEMSFGLIAGSMGLVADSLDMLADASVYGLGLYAVGKSSGHKRAVARISGWSQLLLAALGIFEVVRRFAGTEQEPISWLMIAVSILALAGNVASLILLQRARSNEAHIRATSICTSNDVLVNLGVILAGILVYATSSKLPDLVIGAAVFALVAYGAVRILKIASARTA